MKQTSTRSKSHTTQQDLFQSHSDHSAGKSIYIYRVSLVKDATISICEVRIYAPDLAVIGGRTEMVERYYQRNRQIISACSVVHAFISQKEEEEEEDSHEQGFL